MPEPITVDGYTSRGQPVPEYWIRQISAGKAFRRKYAQEAQWETWRRWYRGQWDQRQLPKNVFFKFIRTLIPRIYFRNPSVSIVPTKPGLENALLCKVLERADNKLIRLLGVKEQMKAAVQNACMFGTGGLKLGYGAEFTATPEMSGYIGDVRDPDVGPKSFLKRVEYNDLVHPNMPWIMSEHPGSVVIPAGARDFHSARWVAFERIRPAADVKADPRYKNTSQLPDYSEESRLIPGSGYLNRVHLDGVTIFEIHDKKTEMVFCIAPDARSTAEKCLYVGDDGLQINRGLPFYPLIFNNDDEVFWGIPDSQIIAPQQIEANETRTMIRAHRRISVLKFLYEKGNITADELSKLIDGNSQGGVQVNSLTGVKELTIPGIPPGLLESDALADREIQEVLGLGTNQFGEYAPGSADRSATEAGIVNQASMIRMDERRDMAADMLVAVVTDMNQLILENWSPDTVMDVVGPLGVPIWIKASKDAMLSAQFDLNVDPDSALPETRALREQKAVQTYGILKTNPLVNPVELTNMLVNEMSVSDRYTLLTNPLMQSTQERPLELQEAAQAYRNLPMPQMQQLQAQLAGQPAEVIPPTFQS